MTPNHDHATLFLAPSAPSAARPEPILDDGAAAMRRLRHPFAVPTVRATAPTRSGRAD